MQTTSDFTVIGGGVIGLMTARALRLSGASVTVIDKNTIGQESSWAGGGILLPLYPWRQAEAITRLVMQSLSLYPSLAQDLLASTAIDPEWTPCGLLITENPDSQCAIDWCINNGMPYAQATSEQLKPFNTKIHNPLWLPSIAQARNPRLLKSLQQDLRNRGVTLVEQCQVMGFKQSQKRIQRVLTHLGEWPVEHLIICSGAWTPHLVESLRSHAVVALPEIKPVKGQMLLFDAKPGLLSPIILAGDRYLIPRRDGKILAGSTVEHEGFDKSISANAGEDLHNFATQLMPALNDYPVINHWAGLRPGTAQGIPYIGLHPQFDNLSINAGHFRNGLAMAPASAQLLTDILLGRTPAIAPDPYQFSAPH